MAPRPKTIAAIKQAQSLIQTGKYSSLKALAVAVGVSERTLRDYRISLSNNHNTDALSAAGITLTPKPQTELPPEPAWITRCRNALPERWPPWRISEFLKEEAKTDEDIAAVILHRRTGAGRLYWIEPRYSSPKVQHALLLNPLLPAESVKRVTVALVAADTPTDSELFDLCRLHPNAMEGFVDETQNRFVLLQEAQREAESWTTECLRRIPLEAKPKHLSDMTDTFDHDQLAGVALHPNSPEDILNYIAARHPMRFVQHALLLNHKLPAWGIGEIITTLGDPPNTPATQELFELCARHPNAPDELRHRSNVAARDTHPARGTDGSTG